MKKLMNEVMDKKIQLCNRNNNDQLLISANTFEEYLRLICSRGQPKDGFGKNYKCFKSNRKNKRRKKIILKLIG